MPTDPVINVIAFASGFVPLKMTSPLWMEAQPSFLSIPSGRALSPSVFGSAFGMMIDSPKAAPTMIGPLKTSVTSLYGPSGSGKTPSEIDATLLPYKAGYAVLPGVNTLLWIGYGPLLSMGIISPAKRAAFSSSSSLRRIGELARRVATGGWWGEFFFVILVIVGVSAWGGRRLHADPYLSVHCVLVV